MLPHTAQEGRKVYCLSNRRALRYLEKLVLSFETHVLKELLYIFEHPDLGYVAVGLMDPARRQETTVLKFIAQYLKMMLHISGSLLFHNGLVLNSGQKDIVTTFPLFGSK